MHSASTSSTTFSARPMRSFALGVALAIASGASLVAWAQPPGGAGGHGGAAMHGAPGYMLGSPRQLDRLLDGVNATDAQRTQIKQIAQTAAADLKAQRQSGRELREQQMALFTQPTVDANAVEAVRQKMLAQHDQASQRITQAMVEASRVLTPEQRVQLAEKMKSRRDLMKRHQRERRDLDKQTG